MISTTDAICPCRSGKQYPQCCQPYHEGVAYPTNAIHLMLSRYSGYAREQVDYLMATTHRDHYAFKQPREKWRQDILNFSRSMGFEGVELLKFSAENLEAYVTFKALLKQGSVDASFIEKSFFLKVGGKWYYREAVDLMAVSNP